MKRMSELEKVMNEIVKYINDNRPSARLEITSHCDGVRVNISEGFKMYGPSVDCQGNLLDCLKYCLKQVQSPDFKYKAIMSQIELQNKWLKEKEAEVNKHREKIKHL